MPKQGVLTWTDSDGLKIVRGISNKELTSRATGKPGEALVIELLRTGDVTLTFEIFP